MAASTSRQRDLATSPAPLPLTRSLLFFALPSLGFGAAVYLLLPALDRAGLPLLANFLISVGGPLGLLALAALLAYRREGRPWTGAAFRARMRLARPTRSVCLWATALGVFMVLSNGFLSFTAEWIKDAGAMPDALSRMQQLEGDRFMGEPLSGEWWMLLGYTLFVLLNVLGEELWWRGYILPRQELALGRHAWLPHGLLWTLFHLFFYWELVMLLPGALALAYVARRTRSTWPGVIAHTIYNLPGVVIIAVGVLR